MVGFFGKKLRFIAADYVKKKQLPDVFPLKVLDTFPNNIAVVDNQGIIRFVNSSWLHFAEENDAKMTAVGPGVSYLKVCEEACRRQPTDESIAALDGLMQILGGESGEFRLEYPCHSPEVKRWFIMNCQRMTDPLSWALISHEDITERRKAEEALRESGELYHSLFEKNTSTILLINPESARIVDANPAACSFYGYSRNQMKRLTVENLNVMSEEEVQAEIKRVEAGEKSHFDFQHRLADGSITDVEVFSCAIRVRERSLLCSIIHDVSEKKHYERERDVLISGLQNALSEIKTLRGILPICSNCKKIRDDSGSWEQIESYINKRSEAQFSHGICPDCVKELYPDIAPDLLKKYFKDE